MDAYTCHKAPDEETRDAVCNKKKKHFLNDSRLLFDNSQLGASISQLKACDFQFYTTDFRLLDKVSHLFLFTLSFLEIHAQFSAIDIVLVEA